MWKASYYTKESIFPKEINKEFKSPRDVITYLDRNFPEYTGLNIELISL